MEPKIPCPDCARVLSVLDGSVLVNDTLRGFQLECSVCRDPDGKLVQWHWLEGKTFISSGSRNVRISPPQG